MSRVKMGMDGGAMFSNPKVSRKLAIVPQGISADLIATIEGFDRKTFPRRFDKSRFCHRNACGGD